MRSGLRFDRVAQAFIERLEKALSDSVPAQRTLVVTVTAPIRQDSKTRIELEEAIRGMLARPSKDKALALALYGNEAQARLIALRRSGRKVIGFVHNPDVDPEILFEATRVVLTGFSPKGRG